MTELGKLPHVNHSNLHFPFSLRKSYYTIFFTLHVALEVGCLFPLLSNFPNPVLMPELTQGMVMNLEKPVSVSSLI